ncbi:MAG: DNA replication/repair protein RecF [Frankiaceae bacterium]
MHVTSLELVDFRSYPQVVVELPPGPTAFIGANGHGKTNLVEAVGYLATLGSHRVAVDAPLVRMGASRAVVRGRVQRPERELIIEVEVIPGRGTRARVNRTAVPRPRDVLGLLRTVLFAPEDLAVVKGDPAERRRFLDQFLTVRTPRFASVRSDYERALRQRNTLLRTAAATRRPVAQLQTLDVWDGHLAAAGAQLLAGRLDTVDALRPMVEKCYSGLAAGSVQLEYCSALPGLSDLPLARGAADRGAIEALLVAELSRLRAREVERGLTLVGPHRDDLGLSLGGLPARGYASHGESWSLALALRLACWELLREEADDPVLVLDDVFAELDTTRRSRLAEVAAGAEQVLVTAAVAADVPPQLHGVRYRVEAGEVIRVG